MVCVAPGKSDVNVYRTAAGDPVPSEEQIAMSSLTLDEVSDVAVDQSGWQGWLNLGNLRFITDNGHAIKFAFLGNPELAYERSLESLEAADPAIR